MKKTTLALLLLGSTLCVAPRASAQVQVTPEYQVTTEGRQKHGYMQFATNCCPPAAHYYQQQDLWMNWDCTWLTYSSVDHYGTNSYHTTTRMDTNSQWQEYCVGRDGTFVMIYTYSSPASFAGTAACTEWAVTNLDGSPYFSGPEAYPVTYTDHGNGFYGGAVSWDFYGHGSDSGLQPFWDGYWESQITDSSCNEMSITRKISNPVLLNAVDHVYGLATNTCHILLSDEYPTTNLLTPFAFSGSDWENPAGKMLASTVFASDQSTNLLTGLRSRFQVTLPAGRTNRLPVAVHTHLNGFTNQTLSIAGRDLFQTNYIECIGTGSPDWYPTGKPFAVHPPFGKVVNGDCIICLGGTSEVLPLDYHLLNDEKDKGCDSLNCPSCSSDAFAPQEPGMPNWWVTEPFINLWAADTPVQYTTSLGQKLGFSAYYNQRDTRPTSINGTNAFVPPTGWNHNWFSYIHFTGDSSYDETSATFTNNSFANWTAVVYSPGGGQAAFSSGQTQPDPASGDQLFPLDAINSHVYPSCADVPDGGPSVYGAVGFRLVHADGSQDIYGTVTPLYPTTYTNIMPLVRDGSDTQAPNTVWALGHGSSPAAGTAYAAFKPAEIAVFTNGSGSSLVLRTNWAQLVSDSVIAYGPVQLRAPLCADAVLTEHIDPYGNSIHLYYGGGTNAVCLPPPLRLQSLVDYDSRQTTFSYSNGCVCQVSMPYGRTASFSYDTNGQLRAVTDAVQMTSTFGYDGSSYLGSIGTPYGTTVFTHFETNQTGLGDSSNAVPRALLVSNPDSSHELYAFFNRALNSAPACFTGSEVPAYLEDDHWTPHWPLDTGSDTTEAGAMYMRNSCHWGRAQFERLSVGSISLDSLSRLQPGDFRLARMAHWMLDADGVTVASAKSMTQEPSADGVTPGLRTWYAYGNTSSDVWRFNAGASELPVLSIHLQPDGTPWYQWLTYHEQQPWQLSGATTLYVAPDGITRVQEQSIGFDTFTYSATCFTNGTEAGMETWSGSRPNSADGPRYSWSADATAVSAVTNRTVVGPDGVTYLFRTVYPRYPQVDVYDGINDDPTRLVFNGRQQLQLAKLPTGLTVSNYYGTDGFLSETIALETLTTNSYTFQNGLPLSHTDPLGLYTTYTWDNLERLTTIQFPDNTTLNNVYTRLDVTAQKDRLGHWSYAEFDSMRRLKSATDRNGNVTHLDYCTCGGLDSITDPAGNATLFYRDLNGRVTNTVFGDQGNRSFTLDSLGRPVSIADSSGATVDCFYDNLGRLIRATTPQGLVFGAGYRYEMDDTQPYVLTNADGILVTNEYLGWCGERPDRRAYANGIFQHWDWSGSLLNYTEDAASNKTSYLHDPAGRVFSVQDANLNTVGFRYGRAGELLSLTNENGAVTRWTYDSYGRALTKVNGNGSLVETNGFDANGRLTAHWTPAKGLTRYGYDNSGNLLSIASPNSTISYRYDALNRIIGMSDASGASSFSYQGFGAFSSALATETSPFGDSVTRSYVQGQLRSLSLGSWSQTYQPDSQGHLQSISSPAGSFGYTYNGAGSQLQSLSLPGGSAIGYAYDPAGLLKSTALTNSLQQVLDSAAYTYNLSGLRTNVVRDGGVEVSYLYDAIGQLTKATGYEPNGTLRPNENFSYTYNPAGNLTNRINDCLTQAFITDPANQLTNIARLVNQITESGALTNVPYRLEVNGALAVTNLDLTFAARNLPLLNGLNNFTNVLKLSSAPSTWSTNVLAKSLPVSVRPAFDQNGNMTSDGLHGYTYDDASQLVTITLTNVSQSVFVYDGLGRRRIRREYAWATNSSGWRQISETRYVYDGMLVLQERDQNGSPKVTYTRGLDLSGSLQGAGGIGGLLARTDGNGSAYYHADGAGNITAMVDAQGNTAARYLYDPFSNTLGKWGPLVDANLIRASSKEYHSPSGHYNFGFRDYAPEIARWLNQDPIGEEGGFNLFRFCANNPLGCIDPLGHDNMVPSKLYFSTTYENTVSFKFQVRPETKLVLPNRSTTAPGNLPIPVVMPTGGVVVTKEWNRDAFADTIWFAVKVDAQAMISYGGTAVLAKALQVGKACLAFRAATGAARSETAILTELKTRQSLGLKSRVSHQPSREPSSTIPSLRLHIVEIG